MDINSSQLMLDDLEKLHKNKNYNKLFRVSVNPESFSNIRIEYRNKPHDLLCTLVIFISEYPFEEVEFRREDSDDKVKLTFHQPVRLKDLVNYIFTNDFSSLFVYRLRKSSLTESKDKRPSSLDLSPTVSAQGGEIRHEEDSSRIKIFSSGGAQQNHSDSIKSQHDRNQTSKKHSSFFCLFTRERKENEQENQIYTNPSNGVGNNLLIPERHAELDGTIREVVMPRVMLKNISRDYRKFRPKEYCFLCSGLLTDNGTVVISNYYPAASNQQITSPSYCELKEDFIERAIYDDMPRDHNLIIWGHVHPIQSPSSTDLAAFSQIRRWDQKIHEIGYIRKRSLAMLIFSLNFTVSVYDVANQTPLHVMLLTSS